MPLLAPVIRATLPFMSDMSVSQRNRIGSPSTFVQYSMIVDEIRPFHALSRKAGHGKANEKRNHSNALLGRKKLLTSPSSRPNIRANCSGVPLPGGGGNAPVQLILESYPCC